MAERVIFHLDMDAFFVSVEELYDPSLKGKPVLIGGRPNERGVVAAASYAARKFGCHSAMPLRQAYKLCPQAVFLPGDMQRYKKCSREARAVMQDFSPLVEMASIDEAYIDMSGSERLFGPPLRVAHLLHQAMKERTGLNCSIGLSTARVVSKICSDQAKPNGVLWIPPGCEAAFLAPLEAARIPGVGKATEQRLKGLGVRTIGDLQRLGAGPLGKELGLVGSSLYEKAFGRDAGGWFAGEIGEEEEAKSIGHEHTFALDTADEEQLIETLSRLCQMVARRMREHGLAARRVQLKLRYKDFTTITRSRTLERPTLLDQQLFAVARELFFANWKRGSAIRLIGVQGALFEPERQMDLLVDVGGEQRQLQAMSVADRLRDKYGESVVSLGRGLGLKLREKTQETPAARVEDKPASQ